MGNSVLVEEELTSKEKDLHQTRKQQPRKQTRLLWLGGIGFTFIVALVGVGLARVPGFDRVGPLACAIILAIAYRQIAGYPEALRAGIEFSSKKLLRLAIVLFGLKLNIDVLFNQGIPLMIRDIGTIVFAILLTTWLAKRLKGDFSLSLLLGVGTGICGAAAIAAVSPIIKAKDEDTAMGVGIIALMGTVFALAYTVLRPFLPLSAIDYGIWSGISLHEIAHVALAAAPGGQDALAIGLLAKLGRVFLLIPVCFILMYWIQRKGTSSAEAKIPFPWFLVGFIVMSLVGSYVIGTYILIPEAIMEGVSKSTTFILAMAMVGLGLNVSFRDVRTKALRPLAAMTVTSVLLSLLTFWTL